MTVEARRHRTPHVVSPEITPENAHQLQFSGVIHGELSSLLLVLLSSGQTSRTALLQGLHDRQGDSPGWSPVPNEALDSHLERLKRLGLIKTGENIRGLRWMETEYGAGAVPLAGSLLELSLQAPDTSFRSLFEVNYKPKKDEEGSDWRQFAIKKPEKQYALYRSLVERKLSMDEIAGILDQRSDHARRTVGRMMAKGFVTSVAGEASKTKQYRVNPDIDPETVHYAHPKDAGFSERVASYAREHPGEWLSTLEIATFMISQNPNLDLAELRRRVARSFQGLAVQGMMEQQHEAIALDPDKKDMFASLVRRVEGFKRGDSDMRREGLLAAERIINTPSEFSALMRKASRAHAHNLREN